jgi:hypothetical protein
MPPRYGCLVDDPAIAHTAPDCRIFEIAIQHECAQVSLLKWVLLFFLDYTYDSGNRCIGDRRTVNAEMSPPLTVAVDQLTTSWSQAKSASYLEFSTTPALGTGWRRERLNLKTNVTEYQYQNRARRHDLIGQAHLPFHRPRSPDMSSCCPDHRHRRDWTMW